MLIKIVFSLLDDDHYRFCIRRTLILLLKILITIKESFKPKSLARVNKTKAKCVPNYYFNTSYSCFIDNKLAKIMGNENVSRFHNSFVPRKN